MVTEFAEIEVKRGSEGQFAHQVEKCKHLFDAAEGCHGFELHQSIEHPEHFVLLVKWASVPDHMEKFQKSEAFKFWRDAVGPSFAAPPKVWHSQTVLK
jgi:quinol monooxygenase YgiN